MLERVHSIIMRAHDVIVGSNNHTVNEEFECVISVSLMTPTGDVIIDTILEVISCFSSGSSW